MIEGLTTPQSRDRKTIMINASHLKAHRTASSQRKKPGRPMGRTKGGMNKKLHAVTDANGRPIGFFVTAGQVSDYMGAAAWLDDLPKAQWMLADRGYNPDRFRDAWQEQGITPCNADRKSRNKSVKSDKRRHKRHNRIEIMFDRPRTGVAPQRATTGFLSAAALTATVIIR